MSREGPIHFNRLPVKFVVKLSSGEVADGPSVPSAVVGLPVRDRRRERPQHCKQNVNETVDIHWMVGESRGNARTDVIPGAKMSVYLAAVMSPRACSISSACDCCHCPSRRWVLTRSSSMSCLDSREMGSMEPGPSSERRAEGGREEEATEEPGDRESAARHFI